MGTIGIVGCGAIGSVLKKWVETYNPAYNILVSDPAKGFNDDLGTAEAVFINIHILTEDDGTQDLGVIEKIIGELADIPVFIRTTLIPGTCDSLTQKLGRRVFFLPEFLTERTAYEDFCNQPMIFTGEIALLRQIFKGKDFVQMSNIEAEIAKYTHNVFGAMKVIYFNGVYELCERFNCSYENVRKGALLSGYINPTHTLVPGPDGKTGYGGKCFPKDVQAFFEVGQGTQLRKIIGAVIDANKLYRK